MVQQMLWLLDERIQDFPSPWRVGRFGCPHGERPRDLFVPS